MSGMYHSIVKACSSKGGRRRNASHQEEARRRETFPTMESQERQKGRRKEGTNKPGKHTTPSTSSIIITNHSATPTTRSTQSPSSPSFLPSARGRVATKARPIPSACDTDSHKASSNSRISFGGEGRRRVLERFSDANPRLSGNLIGPEPSTSLKLRPSEPDS
ncbi:hypothetical protein IE53DRAFT_2474 [Violaceomyces palustris]|uniref:Uncharacterized protein n=1 Tax=Violaceomyces palustris TaxID=1673888 RepID=A0ACD0P800_9BASI|nr:hypothetical protein IE53DRAFT_2474 [Violaceomyces palustris]